MDSPRAILIWAAAALAIILPLLVASTSPLLAWRDPIYIAASFAGIVAMSLLLIQPLLAGGLLPGLSTPRWRRIHRWAGGLLVLAIVVHVVGLWITSPPDVIDALLLASPTPFSIWGVVAMWVVFATALLALCRKRFRPRSWRRGHTTLAALIAISTVIHAALIDGTLDLWTKSLLCVLVLAATGRLLLVR